LGPLGFLALPVCDDDLWLTHLGVMASCAGIGGAHSIFALGHRVERPSVMNEKLGRQTGFCIVCVALLGSAPQYSLENDMSKINLS
jgi:hypothetical protein